MPLHRQETGLSLGRAVRSNSTARVVYKGNCHCGKNRFEATLPKILGAESCTCSLCHKQGYLWAFPEAGTINYTKGGVETLTTFETGVLKHEFCDVCGTGLYGTHTAGPLEGRHGINVRAILEVDPFRLETDIIDTAKSVPEKPIEPPAALLATQPPAQLEGDSIKTYTGSCQCGAVALAVKTPPIPEIEVKEDNCSSCVRNALIGIYPDKDQVTILGKENTTPYGFGQKFNGWPFCKTCGVHCYGIAIGPPQELVDSWPEARQKMVEKIRRIQTVNIRTLNGVEWDQIKVERSDEGTEGYVVAED